MLFAAGAGKSVLAAIALNHLREISKWERSMGVAGIFLNYKEEDAQTLENILAGVCAQLLESQRPLSEKVKELHKKHAERGTRPSSEELIMFVRTEYSTLDKIYIVVDALDEIAESRRSVLFTQLITLSPAVKLFVTSRHIEPIHDDLTAAMRLEVRASDVDLRTYIGRRLQDENRLSRYITTATDLEGQIISTIISKAGGMFLIARLQMDMIANRTSIKAVRKALNHLPDQLDGLYDEAWDRISRQPDDDRQLAERTLIWLVHAYRPLSLGTIQHALAVEHGESDFDTENISSSENILNACAGLITIDPKSKVMRLVHYTTQEYFESHTKFLDAHGEITKTCITFLSYDPFESTRSRGTDG